MADRALLAGCPRYLCPKNDNGLATIPRNIKSTLHKYHQVFQQAKCQIRDVLFKVDYVIYSYENHRLVSETFLRITLVIPGKFRANRMPPYRYSSHSVSPLVLFLTEIN